MQISTLGRPDGVPVDFHCSVFVLRDSIGSSTVVAIYFAYKVLKPVKN